MSPVATSGTIASVMKKVNRMIKKAKAHANMPPNMATFEFHGKRPRGIEPGWTAALLRGGRGAASGFDHDPIAANQAPHGKELELTFGDKGHRDATA
mmetsp:Transcript_45502/g.83292  ORF Transcript_45502/g.83292 Transcript_45502/m.83292 type:complete len:97 (-) Transcript_45502:1-291(-)